MPGSTAPIDFYAKWEKQRQLGDSRSLVQQPQRVEPTLLNGASGRWYCVIYPTWF